MWSDSGLPASGAPEAAARLAQRQASIAAAVPDRLERIVRDLTPAGSVVLLVGEGGSGRLALAREAARLVAAGQPRCAVVELAEPPHEASGIPSVFPESLGPALAAAEGEDAPDLVARVLTGVAADAHADEIILVAPGIDEYNPRDTRTLELVLRAPSVRAVATAAQLTAAVEQLSSGVARSRVSIAPLDPAEANTYLSGMLGVERIEAETLSRWMAVAGGNSYALTVLAFSCDGAGALRRSRGAAWSTATTEEVPSSYARVLMGTCTPAERDVLELVALAEPITETVLLRSLDAACVTALYGRGLLVSQPSAEGSALLTGNALLASLLRAGMSPVRRLQLNDQIFRLLADDPGVMDPIYAPDRLMRLVVFGLEGGHVLPLPWLWTAFERTVGGGDPRLVLNLSLAVTAHPDADASQATVAALRAHRLARLLGDAATLRPLLGMMRGIQADPVRYDALSAMLRVRLACTLIEQEVWDDGDSDRALAAVAEVEEWAAQEDEPVRGAVQATRVQILAYSGRLREAAAAAPPAEVSPDLKVEWVWSPARALHALVLDQQGAVGRALESAQHTRMLSQLGPRARPDFVDLHSFGWLLSCWGSGSSEAARQVLDELVADIHADVHAEARYSGLVEAGAVLLGVQEGRWADTAQHAELLLDRLARHDSAGLSSLVQGALGLALAVLGERDAALRALRAAEVPSRGLGQVLGGTRRMLILRAQQWLRLADVADGADRLVEWARAEELPLIELQALHVGATERRGVSAELLARARERANSRRLLTLPCPRRSSLTWSALRRAAGRGRCTRTSQRYGHSRGWACGCRFRPWAISRRASARWRCWLRWATRANSLPNACISRPAP